MPRTRAADAPRTAESDVAALLFQQQQQLQNSRSGSFDGGSHDTGVIQSAPSSQKQVPLPAHTVVAPLSVSPPTSPAGTTWKTRCSVSFHPHPHLWTSQPVTFALTFPEEYPAQPPVATCTDPAFVAQNHACAALDPSTGASSLQILRPGPLGWSRNNTLSDVIYCLRQTLVRGACRRDTSAASDDASSSSAAASQCVEADTTTTSRSRARDGPVVTLLDASGADVTAAAPVPLLATLSGSHSALASLASGSVVAAHAALSSAGDSASAGALFNLAPVHGISSERGRRGAMEDAFAAVDCLTLAPAAAEAAEAPVLSSSKPPTDSLTAIPSSLEAWEAQLLAPSTTTTAKPALTADATDHATAPSYGVRDSSDSATHIASDESSRLSSGGNGLGVYAVMDGHGGDRAANFVAERLLGAIKEQLRLRSRASGSATSSSGASATGLGGTGSAVASALHCAFLQLDADFEAYAKRPPHSHRQHSHSHRNNAAHVVEPVGASSSSASSSSLSSTSNQSAASAIAEHAAAGSDELHRPVRRRQGSAESALSQESVGTATTAATAESSLASPVRDSASASPASSSSTATAAAAAVIGIGGNDPNSGGASAGARISNASRPARSGLLPGSAGGGGVKRGSKHRYYNTLRSSGSGSRHPAAAQGADASAPSDVTGLSAAADDLRPTAGDSVPVNAAASAPSSSAATEAFSNWEAGLQQQKQQPQSQSALTSGADFPSNTSNISSGRSDSATGGASSSSSSSDNEDDDEGADPLMQTMGGRRPAAATTTAGAASETQHQHHHHHGEQSGTTAVVAVVTPLLLQQRQRQQQSGPTATSSALSESAAATNDESSSLSPPLGLLTVAAVGDSRAVLCRGGSPLLVSPPEHHTSRPDERARILNAGGFSFGCKLSEILNSGAQCWLRLLLCSTKALSDLRQLADRVTVNLTAIQC